MEIVSELHRIMDRKIANLPKRLRPLFDFVLDSNKKAFIIVGPRGVGKTTLMLSYINNKNFLYFSGDNPLVATMSLWQLGQEAFNEGYDGIAVDEVHFINNWSVELKALYDAYPKKQFIASDSSSLVLRQGIGDLSRRFLQVKIPLMSFREYLYLSKGKLYEKVNPFKKGKKVDISSYYQELNILKEFKKYLNTGFRPIFLEGDYQERLAIILEKTIYSDVPFFVPSLKENHLRLMNAVIGYLAVSPIPRLKVRSLCSEWQLGAEKLYDLLNVMEHVGLINVIKRPNDHKVNSVGEKIFFHDPSMYGLYKSQKGNVREAFVATMLRTISNNFFASKDEEKADFILDSYILEVGGKAKSIKSADFVIRDDFELPQKNIIPLWVIGLLY